MRRIKLINLINLFRHLQLQYQIYSYTLIITQLFIILYYYINFLQQLMSNNKKNRINNILPLEFSGKKMPEEWIYQKNHRRTFTQAVVYSHQRNISNIIPINKNKLTIEKQRQDQINSSVKKYLPHLNNKPSQKNKLGAVKPKLYDFLAKNPLILQSPSKNNFVVNIQKHNKVKTIQGISQKKKTNRLTTIFNDKFSDNKTDDLERINNNFQIQLQKNKMINKSVQAYLKYEMKQIIGKGTFGVVYKASNKKTHQIVAIKKVFQDKNYKNRQCQILKVLNHPNLISMIDHFYSIENNDQQYLNIVMDYYKQNLMEYNNQYNAKQKKIPPQLVKIIFYQLFRALNYLSSLSIAHRDIKPQNILIRAQSNKVVIIDFGSAKQIKNSQPNLAYICSRWYRAPQLIVGATNYTAKVDVWSMGCTMVQMINGVPPFMGNSQGNQLIQIIKILGTPTKEQIYQMNPQYNISQDFNNRFLGRFQNYKQIFNQKIDQKLQDLIKNIFQYSPKRRYNAFEVLCHPYFDDLRNQSYVHELRKNIKFPSLFDFSKEQIKNNPTLQKKLIPDWTLKTKIY